MKLGIVGAGMIVKDFLTMTPLLPEIELKAITGTPHGIDNMEKLQMQYGLIVYIRTSMNVLQMKKLIPSMLLFPIIYILLLLKKPSKPVRMLSVKNRLL